MEGSGAYNKYAKLPAGGAALALPLLEKAARSVALDASEQPVVIADYGSSQGKNSIVPMRVAINALRERAGPNRPIFVFHIDQPSNDFNSLFAVLERDVDSYASADANVFASAIGKSFYESVLPPGSVHLGWSSYAAVWLSRVPTLIPGHFIAARATGAVREEFDQQGARDWEAFLSLRAQEMRRGGRLVVVLPALDDNGTSGFEHLMDQANAVLGEMVTEGKITAAERQRMVLQAFPRRKRDLLAPFARNGHFQDLSVEDIVTFDLPDAVWLEYERDGDREALATKHALFFRAIFMPSLASALDRVRAGDAQAIGAFGDRLERGLKRRLASQPKAMHSFVQAMVLGKQAI
jgi:hypothetical protein